MNPRWVRHNKLITAILIYMFLFVLFNLIKPPFIYNSDGTMKEFGVGFRRKTIIPVWLLSIFLAILSYLFVVYYTSNYR